MADEVTVNADVRLLVTEVIDAADMELASSEEDRTVTHSSQNTSKKLTGSSTPNVDRVVLDKITLGAGTTTISLTAAPKSGSRTEDMTGKKVCGAIIKTATGNNSSGVTIAPGAANPYPLWGTGNDIVMGPGRTEAFVFGDDTDSDLPAVSGTVEDIDISGTSGDVVQIVLLLGA